MVELLRDPEIEVQNRAIDVVIKANDPDTIKYLIEILKDENENARRAAVEVLNEVGNARSVKYLLEAIADSDWWVRSRAADALGKIGGPKVVDAVLQLIKDENEDIRRSAIEILNQTKDERAVLHTDRGHQGQGLVGQRARGRCAGGHRQPQSHTAPVRDAQGGSVPKSMPVVVRALGKLGDPRLIDPILVKLQTQPSKELKVEALQALALLADDKRVEQIRVQLQQHMSTGEAPWRERQPARWKACSADSTRRPGHRSHGHRQALRSWARRCAHHDSASMSP